jgi:hypothetical protein
MNTTRITGNSPAVQSSGQVGTPRRVLGLQGVGGGLPCGQEMETLGQPVAQRHQGEQEQQQREVADPLAEEPAAEIDRQHRVQRGGQGAHETHQSST